MDKVQEILDAKASGDEEKLIAVVKSATGHELGEAMDRDPEGWA